MRRAKSSYMNLRKKRYLNEFSGLRNQSSINKNKEISLENNNLEHYPNQDFSTTNKDYGISPNDYKSKYSNQLKRKKMFQELWSKKPNLKKNIGLLDTIKVQSKSRKNHYNNIIGDLKGIVKKKRIESAGTFCNIPIKSKQKPNISSIIHNSSINIKSLTKNDTKNVSSKINFNINSDINTNTQSN